ncbi:hypothetical protein [Paenibacillus sedimenti]|uniref:Uncharacterized protein n=1 Tax=Paenibacillus sedimenti TaxID=2770274 RepID=A0A926KZ28_9BACL|nr:hypothetical protein [Paenibacillus sedimenti]MBD0384878.1 hypothetical protein [Paenibacillus sedimenti]
MQIEEIMKPGITGFIRYPDKFDEQDSKEFEMYLYQVLNWNKGKVIFKELLANNKNFFTYLIELNHKEYYLLSNSTYPLLAFASSVDYSGIIFIDPIDIFDTSLPNPYKILNKELLNKPIEIYDLERLRDYEIKNLKYWNPKTIGEVVFNYWD